MADGEHWRTQTIKDDSVNDFAEWLAPFSVLAMI